MHRLAAMSHDPRVIGLVQETAAEIEADLAMLRQEQNGVEVGAAKAAPQG